MPASLSSWHWPAPAKLNLYLHITNKRADGYHELDTLFQLLDWGDSLQFIPRSDKRLCLDTPLPGVDDAAHLCLRAAHALQRHVGYNDLPGISIRVNKRVPMGGGLGGGSSDAATVLHVLNRYWSLGLDTDTLAQIGCCLGADVPVFVHGHTALAQGIGERISRQATNACGYLILTPAVAVSTALIFSRFRLTSAHCLRTIPAFFQGSCGNDLQAGVLAAYPDIDRLYHWLFRFGDARMTGTGSSLFLPVKDRQEAEEIGGQCPWPVHQVYARGRNRSPLFDAMAEQDFSPAC